MSELDLVPAEPTFDEALSILESLAAPGAKHEAPPALPVTTEPPVPRPVLAAHWSEETHRALLESLPDAVVVIDAAGAIVLVNEQTERLFGYARAELLGLPIEILVPERYRSEHVAHRRRYFDNPRSRPMGVNLELSGRRKDGSLFPVEISLSPLRTEQGMLATSVIRDVSLRERETAKFRTLVENIPAVTFIAPLDESVPELYVSPQIEELLGFSQREWVEDPVLWHRQLHPEDRERWNKQFAPTCASGTPFNSIYRFLAKDGHTVWVHGSARMVRDAEGKLLFLQGVAFDITAIKEAEAALKRSKEELERHVQERTRELQRSLSELEEKTKELRDFADQAAHDLKKPLTSLKSWPQKLAAKYQGQFDEEAEGWIQKTINGARRMERLIYGIEHYSKYLQHDQELPSVDCVAIAGDACLDLHADLEACGGNVAVGALPAVAGHPVLLMLLFQNLIGNAIKYREANRPLRVEVGAQPDTDGWRFWVRDNGIGIEPKYFAKIFVLGERLHTERTIPGWGYGLSICERIVKRRGGRMWVESQLGEGSTFFFTWPATAPGK